MNRLVHLNPVDISMLSGVTPAGFDCTIDFVYRSAINVTVNVDLAATLVLTGRTSNRSTSYIVPATDVVNGKARAVIPGGDLNDPNGYDMTLVGTVDAARKVLASGVLKLTSEGIPDLPLADIIDTIDIVLDYDEACELDIALWKDSAGGTPYDLSDESTIVRANVYSAKGGGVLQAFAVTPIDDNKVTITLTVDQVNTLPENCWWALDVSKGGGITTIAEGKVTVVGSITPPLPTSTFNYSYQKPATFADPASGQIVQGTNTMSHLQVNKIDNDLVDRSATLALIEPGDTVTIGATTWTIGLARDYGAWLTFEILPIAQDAATGTVAVTFTRP